MKLTPDALLLGPLVIGWERLALVLGLMVFVGIASRGRNPKLEQTAWWGAVAGALAGRLGYVALNWQDLAGAGGLELLRSVVDIRSGGFFWPLAAGVGALVLVWRLRADALKLAPAILLGALAAVLPLLLRPTPTANAFIGPETALVRLEPSGEVHTITWSDLPKPVLLNFWATWCPPCRAEMPLLAEYARKGYSVVLMNDGEGQETVQAYLKKYGLEVPVYQSETLYEQLGISGLPTSLRIEADGKVSTRHLGALNRAQLEALLEAP